MVEKLDGAHHEPECAAVSTSVWEYPEFHSAVSEHFRRRPNALRRQLADWSMRDPSLCLDARRIDSLLQGLELQAPHHHRKRRAASESRKKKRVTAAATTTTAPPKLPPPAHDVVVID